ncbi:hypothetical protein [Paenibacillus sp. NPDC058071]|uniref:hypothetical protein n=1 Tax=Paenibacillus sp. NPDC058071 TaxID=3346326 RepID=UPI0036DC9F52
MKEQEQTICPWCMTEIVWDEEIGPEEYCPHCENELSGYRTMQIGMEDEEGDANEEDEREWDAQDEDESYGGGYKEGEEGFRRTTRSRLAAEETLQSIIDHQEEAPECPSCREYMIEAGKQTVDDSFTPTIHASAGQALLETPFELTLYVCPSCFHTSTLLGYKDREKLLNALNPRN